MAFENITKFSEAFKLAYNIKKVKNAQILAALKDKVDGERFHSVASLGCFTRLLQRTLFVDVIFC